MRVLCATQYKIVYDKNQTSKGIISMTLALSETTAPIYEQVVSHAGGLAQATQNLLDYTQAYLRALVLKQGRFDKEALEREQHALHSYAWYATYSETMQQMALYLERLQDEENLGENEMLLASIGLGEYTKQILGGIPMGQNEIARPDDIGLQARHMEAYGKEPSVRWFLENGNTKGNRVTLTQALQTNGTTHILGQSGLDDTMEAFREEMRRFAETEVVPYAHEWHLNNEYIPLDVISKMAELGVFGLTIPEEYGGLGLGKESMCVVSEELSRAYIGVGSLSTRSEIAAELILCGGTDEQKNEWLPKLASGEVLPTAVFTEPNTGSDLASLKTRATLSGDVWHVSGNKTWITHPVRADLMTMLVRTKPEEEGYKGLSMLLATKSRGTDENPFPDEGITGGEIEVLGYRGMKEYELAFDDFKVSASGLLGGIEGQGFKHLMQTFEAARIQTAARAVGVAQNALDTGLRYAMEREQFGKAIIQFPRVANKLVMMACETMMARQLTYFAARQKDQDRRCDIEAGMAKLLAARIAWANADGALQIHGGNGFALEYAISRILCDARILNIFEGAAEIQAQVIARRLLET
jgi:(2S)-methylsuccinyl-CoA dehydrogenase